MKPKYFEFKVNKEIKPVHHPYICMDTENNVDTGEFILGCLYGYYQDHHGKQHKVEKTFYDRFELMKELERIAKVGGKNNIPFRLGLFNADYDLYYIREIVRDTSRVYVGSKLITARLKVGGERGIPIWDATNLVRGSLEDWIKNLNMEKRYGIKKLSLEDLEQRCLMDTKATWYLFKWLEDVMVYEFKIPLKLTIGACAREIFRRHFQKVNFIRNSDFLNEFERKAYRGGRCEVFKRGLRRIKSYDVNSMYLSIMRDVEIPLPQSAQYYENGAGFDVYKPGVVHCLVHVPEQIIAPLPYYKNKLIFPVGTFEGYWCTPELRAAIDYGSEIIEVYEYIEYEETAPIFKEYAEFIWKKRQQHKKQGDANLDYLYKTLGNSLYGKYGEKNEQGGWIKISDWEGDIEGYDIREYIDGEKYIYVGKKPLDSKHTFPIIPAWITTHARLKLLHEMKKREKYVVYCDTDSIHILSDCPNPIESSKELGGWGFEYETEQIYYRPKFYGKKRKGVPKRAEILNDNDNILEFKYTSPVKRATSIRRGISQNKWIEILKGLRKIDDKRVWDDKTGESMPICVNIKE